MTEFQIRALFENRFGAPPEEFGLDVVSSDEDTHLTTADGNKTVTLRVVNDMQAGWFLNGEMHCDTPPQNPILRPTDPERITNGEALRAALA